MISSSRSASGGDALDAGGQDVFLVVGGDDDGK
jgi:hypothetical protein